MSSEIRARYVFLDPRGLKETRHVVRRFHRARKLGEPVLVEDRPWEKGGVQVRQGVQYHDGVFRMWYQTYDAKAGDSIGNTDIVATAQSTDGVHWEKPEVGLLEFEGSRKNNLVALFGCCPAVMRGLAGTEFEGKWIALAIPTAGPWPKRRVSYQLGLSQQVEREPRYMNIVPTAREEEEEVTKRVKDAHGGYLAWVSDDGLDWTPVQDTTVLREMPDGGGTFAADVYHHRYIGAPRREVFAGGRKRRCISSACSNELREWAYPPVSLTPDAFDDQRAREMGYQWAEFYTMPVYPCRDYVIGLLWVFYVSDQGLPFTTMGNHGVIEPQVCYSYDGLSWERAPGRPTFIERGERGEFDAGVVGPGSVVEVGDDLHVYYAAMRGEHGSRPYGDLHPAWVKAGRLDSSCIGLATLKRDRFASMSADAEGFVEMMPRRLIPGELTINARTAVGYVAAELRRPVDAFNSEVIEGFSRDECVIFEGDSVSAPVRWKEKDLKGIDSREEVILRFYLKDAELFAYETSA